MKIAIIGSGVSGATLAREIPGSVVFEKESVVGGRTSSREFSEGEVFDVCATVYSDKFSYVDSDKNSKEYSFINYLKSNQINVESILCEYLPNCFYPKNGMRDLIEKILGKNEIKLNHQLEDISKDMNSGLWQCSFQNGEEYFFEKVILTAPLPKALATLKSSKILSEWENFISPYVEYKTSTMIVAIWRDVPVEVMEKIRSLGQITFFEKFEDIEFVSLESLKYPSQKNHLIVMIQFSQAFSSRNIERWVSGIFPTEFAKKTSEAFFRKFFKSKKIEFPKGEGFDSAFAFRKRYAAPDRSLWDKGNFSIQSEQFTKYLELSRKHNIWLLGDWLFGPRISRCAFGASVLAKEILR